MHIQYLDPFDNLSVVDVLSDTVFNINSGREENDEVFWGHGLLDKNTWSGMHESPGLHPQYHINSM